MLPDQLQEFQFLFNNMTEGVFFQNADGELVDVNPAALAMLGLSYDQFVRRTSFHPEWRVVNEDGTPLLPEQYPSNVALRSSASVTGFVAGVFNPQRQQFVWLKINATPMYLPDEKLPYRVFVTLHDISAQKHAALALQESEARLRTIVNNQTEFVDRFLPGGILTFVNDALCRYVGASAEELLGTSFFRFIHEDDRLTLAEKLSALTPEQPTLDSVERIALSDGKLRWHHWTNTAIFDSHGVITEYQSVGRDINDQKQAEMARLENAENLELALRAAKAGTWNWIIATNRLQWSREFFYLIGMNPDTDDASFATWQSILHPDDYDNTFQSLEQACVNQSDLDIEYRIILPDGQIRWLHCLGHTEYDDAGEQVRMRGICLDISERKQQAEAVERSEQTAAAILNAVTDPIMLLDENGMILMLNEAMAQRFGRSAGLLTGANAFSFLPDDVQALRREKLAEAFSKGIAMRFEDVREGMTIDNLIYPVVNSENIVTSVAIFARDITARKKELEELAYVNECFTQALYGSQHILYRLNVKKDCYDYLSPASEKIHGIPYAEGIKYGLKQVMERIHPDDSMQISALISDAIRARTSNSIDLELEYRLRKSDGEYCWLHDSTTLIVDDNGDIQCFFGSASDISERKKMECDLRESEERYRRFIATANEGIGIVDGDYRITYVNDRMAEIAGYRAEELLGKQISAMLRVADKDTLTGKMTERKKGISDRYEYRHRRKDGSDAWLLVSSTPIFDSSGTFQGAFSMVTDMTDRKNAEFALLQAHIEMEQRVLERTEELAAANEQIKLMSYQLIRAEEQERIRIAAELHDQVGQALLLAKIKSDTLASEIIADHERTAAAGISALLESSIHDIRNLTFSMRPPLLDTAGIDAALEWLCMSLQKDYNLQVNFSCYCRPLRLADEKRYPLFQSIRELLLNVAKHAGVGRAELVIQLLDGTLEVRVTDNGAGYEFSSGQVGHVKNSGFGLFNVQRRIEQIGGTVAIASSGQGTTVTLNMSP